jgi:hypothetical protein
MPLSLSTLRVSPRDLSYGFGPTALKGFLRQSKRFIVWEFPAGFPFVVYILLYGLINISRAYILMFATTLWLHH